MQPGQRLVRMPCRTVRLSALLLSLVPGCAPRSASRPAVPAARLSPAFVDAAVLARAHPAAAHLHEMDRDIARLEPMLVSRRVRPHAVATPRPALLPEPEAPQERPSPALEPDGARAEGSLREDFAIRRLAQPDRAEEAYEDELERLKKRYLETRPEPLADRPTAESDPATSLARRMSELRRTITSLAPRAGDRLLYPPAELARRRQQLAAAKQELALKEREQLKSIERALEAPARRRAIIPEARMAEARERRDRMRQSEAQSLAAMEQAALARAAQVRLPAPGGPPHSGVSADEQPGAAEAMAVRVRERFNRPAPRPKAGGSATVLGELRRRRAEMAAAILRDTRVGAVAAGREAGLAVTFDRGRAPDRTARIRERLARTEWGNSRGGRL